MSLHRRILDRLRGVFAPERVERDMDLELQSHLRMLTEDYCRSGMSPRDAELEARRRFGNVTRLKDRGRDVRGSGICGEILRDTRHALRHLANDWRFTSAAVLILALAIGVNTAMFSVVNTVLFRSQGFSKPERIVNIYQNAADETGAVEKGGPVATSYLAFQDMAEYTDVFADVAASTFFPMPAKYQAAEGIRPALVEYATSGYLDVLGLDPAVGRWLDAEADEPNGEALAVVGYPAWRTRFGSDPDLVGRTIRINGAPVTIIGIGPEGLASSLNSGFVTDFWLSISAVEPVGLGHPFAPDVLNSRDQLVFLTRARLVEGVTLPKAQAAMDNLADRLEMDHPDDPGLGITVLALNQVQVHPQLDMLLVPGAAVLLTSVGLVLLIACGNLSTLLLVRGSVRSREIGIRMALGAGRGQIVRHLLVENVLLALGGGMGGYVLGRLIVHQVASLDLPIVVDIALDYRVFAFTMVLSVVAGLAFGMAPALKSARVDLIGTLRDGGENLSANRSWFTAKNALVMLQVSTSFLLVAGTGLLLRNIIGFAQPELGFAVDGVAILETDALYTGYGDNSQTVYEELLERIAAIPGVEAATLTRGAPAADFNGNRSLIIDGYQPASGEASVPVDWMMAGPGYFDTLEIPLLYGRAFDITDQADSPTVVVINETMARRYFGIPNAVGRRFRFEGSGISAEVIGVTRDVRRSLDENEAIRPLFYRPFTQAEHPPTVVIARWPLDSATLVGAMQRELRALNYGLPVVRATTMAAHLERMLIPIKVALACLGGLALVGLVLASLGLYGIVSYAVANRTREIGIRMAVGARSAQVVRLVTRGVTGVVAVGVGLGFGLSILAVRGLAWLALSLSEGSGANITPPSGDPLTFALVAVVIVCVGVLASYVPARRAAAGDLLKALRHDG
jgi:predicted permease